MHRIVDLSVKLKPSCEEAYSRLCGAEIEKLRT
jgi:hypothetical protein